MGNEHPDLIEPTRELLEQIGLPYVIENVPGAPLEGPFELCGAMFQLGTYRHRLFETNFYVEVPEHPNHVARTTKMGRKPVDGEMMHVVGNFSGVEKAKKAMGIDWMTRDGLRESIPPAYTRHIGADLMEEVLRRQDAPCCGDDSCHGFASGACDRNAA
jgi:DNA (cytosine-5)-methyltransferase 1